MFLSCGLRIKRKCENVRFVNVKDRAARKVIFTNSILIRLTEKKPPYVLMPH